MVFIWLINFHSIGFVVFICLIDLIAAICNDNPRQHRRKETYY